MNTQSFLTLFQESSLFIQLLCVLLVIFLIWYLVTLNKRIKNNKLRKRVLSDGSSDYSGTAKNIVQSIAGARELYKKLITRVHPDKFQNHKNAEAHDLASRITDAKKNYSELLKLEKEVEEFLKK